MNSIKVKLLGTPEVLYNEQVIVFPFRKVEALFYYLAIKKNASRDELVDLLWSEQEDSLAKKNLRNAVYTLKKIFDEDVVVSPQRANIMLNADIAWNIDLESFIKCGNSSCVELYTDEFLQGFLVKDAERFEQWMFQKREQYQYMYINKLNKLLKDCWDQKDLKSAEIYCKQLIGVDHLDEDSYRRLMEIYSKEGQHNKGIEVYNKLKSILSKELSISPDSRTIKVFEDLVKAKTHKADKPSLNDEEFFYGRTQELKLIHEAYDNFVKNSCGKAVIVLGEAGIGKSKLVERFFKLSDMSQVVLFETYCYQAEESYPLKPWNEIFSKLSQHISQQSIYIPESWRQVAGCLFPTFDKSYEDSSNPAYERDDILKYQVVESTVLSILRKSAENKKIVLLFEDLQWIDDMSLSLLKSIILQDRNKSIMIIATCRNTFDKKIDRFITEIAVKNLGTKIELLRLSMEDTEAFAYALLNHKLTQELKELIYKETEGNIFFLVEFLNSIKQNNYEISITPKMKDILKSRIINVSEEGKKILNMASVFFDRVSLDILKELSGKDELELIELMEELQQKALLNEIVSNEEIGFEFTHQKLREYIYSEMSASRRRLLHSRIAKLLEAKLQNDVTDRLRYSRLIYHYQHANDKLAQLKYSIKNIEEYLQFSHEIFPILSDIGMHQCKYLYLSYEQARNQLDELERLLNTVGSNAHDIDEFKLLKLSFMHMKGRYYIGQGEYELGISIIDQVIEAAEAICNMEYLLKGLRQKIYYCINTRNTLNMGKYIEKSIEIVEQTRNIAEKGVLLRLKGLYNILLGSFDDAEALLKSSIEIFETQQNKSRYVLNIAAAYNYMGEIKRCKKQFAEAVQLYNKAIAICDDNKLIRGVAIFHTNAGQAAYDLGDYKTAKEHLSRALSLYAQLDTLWRRSTANGYMSLVLMQEKNYTDVLYHLTQSEAYAEKAKNPYELGIVNRIKAEILTQMSKDSEAYNALKGYVDKSMEFYCDIAIELLHEFKDCCEVEILVRMKETTDCGAV